MKTSLTPLCVLVGMLLPLLLMPVSAETVPANFGSAATVPVTAAAYTAAGNTVEVTLNFAPPAGTALTVVNNTGTDAIHGTFDNLGQWQAVELTYDGVVFRFVANYFGGTGNDLVLEWANIRLLAWGGGSTNYGQLGNGTTTNSGLAVPVDMTGVLAGKTVVRAATGESFSVALCADGTLATWGYNYNHRLGNTGTANSRVPVLVDQSGMPAGKTVVAIAAGGSHNLALCADGSVVAWGSNSSGQLGGTGTGTNWSLPIMVNQTGVLAGKTVVAVAAGGNHSLALCADGTLAAWGYNSYGQLGNNSTTNSPVPVLVDTTRMLAGKTVTAIAAGDSHSLALCADGTLTAWGYNNYGQLGNNSLTNATSPVLVQRTGVLAGKPLAAIAAGGSHGLALCADGTLAAWGYNGSGALGNGTTTNSRVPVLVDQTGVLAGRTVAAVVGGGSHNLALCADATLVAWGYNSNGQLGNDSTTNSSVPVAVITTILRPGERIVRVGSGSYAGHSLAMVAMPPPPVGSTLAAADILDTAAILNASINAQGTVTTVTFEYGLTAAYGATVAATPGSVAGTAATVVSARISGLPAGSTWHYRVVASSIGGTVKGADMTFTTTTTASLSGLTPSAGTLFPAFASGTVSYVATVPSATDSITITPVCQNGDAVVTVNGAAVAAGAASGPLALAVGNNAITTVVSANGGANTQTYLLTVTRLPQTFAFNAATDTPVTVGDFVATGNAADFLLGFAPKPGTVLSVVKNTGMNPIRGTFSNLAQGQIVNLTFGGLTYPFVANYFGGTGNDLVLQWASNRLLAWGSNTYGVLGSNSPADSNIPVPVDPGGPLAGKVILANATGGSHRLALCADGTVLAWGSNGSGQLGDGSTTTRYVPVAVDRTGALAGQTVIAIAAGSSHSLALCADGTLTAWGHNNFGQLGNRSTTNSNVPVRVDQTGVLAGKSVIAIAAGSGTSFALCADGAVAAWGDNTNGSLGNKGSASAPVPVLVDRSGVLAGKTIVALEAGEYFALVMCSDGTLATWGDNTYSQLGNTTTAAKSSVPVLVDKTGVLAGRPPVAISAGRLHAMVLCVEGTLAAWGYNPSGQLGNNTTTNSGVPVLVNRSGALAGRTITAIAAGGNHSLALCADGFLAAWGDNNSGQLGLGTTTARSTPTAVIQTALATGEVIASVHGGSAYSLAMVATPPPPIATTLAATAVLDTSATLRGTVNANGANSTISFEYGLTPSYGFSATATPATASGTTSTAVSAALTGLRADTTYHYRLVAAWAAGKTWGSDMTFTTSALASLANLSLSAGILNPAFASTTTGYLTTVPFATTSLTLTPVVADHGATVTVASGSASGPLALTIGGNPIDVVVTAAGGGNTQTYRVTVTRLPQMFTFNSATDVAVTAAGLAATGDAPPLVLNHAPVLGSSLMIVKNTGLGLIAGTFAHLAQGQRVQLTYAGITYPWVVNYFGGSGNDLVLQWADTRLLSCGYNNYGQLGNNTTTMSNVPVPVDMSGVLAGKTVIGIATGNNHGLALCADGTLATWGYSDSTTYATAPVAVDLTGALAGKTVAAIAAGGNGNLALCTDGSLVSFGNGSATNVVVPVALALTGALTGKTVVAIAGGSSHTLALCADGTLAAWGSNTYGQLGNNAPASSAVPVLVDRSGVLAGKTIAAIAAGSAHSLALCADGTLAAWGYNSAGQLGNNSTLSSGVPVLVNQTGVLAGKTVTAIAAGGYHNLARCADGTLAAWGENAHGELGNTTTTSASVPVAVTLTGVLAGRSVSVLAGGGYHTLALCGDGNLATWGYNGYGQLGNGSSTNSSVPVMVTTSGLRTGERFMAMAGGSYHTLALAAAVPVPVASTLAATGVRDTGATLNGSVSAQGTTATVTLEYGPTAAYGTTLTPTPATVTGTAATTVTATLTGLPPGTTYHFRVVATGPGGIATGEDLTFTTSTYATLANLTLSSGQLTPAFNRLTRSYLATVPATVASITLTPVTSTPNATIKISGVTVASGTPGNSINLPTGETVIPIVVAAPDGINTLTYTVKITRLPQSFTFNSATDVPLSVSDFTATGNSATIELNHVPTPGVSLTVVRNTGISPIVGAFDNLAQGQTVNLSFGGIRYVFVADYRGGTGNDLVLYCTKTRLLAWGSNASGQLGGGGTANSSVAAPVAMDGVLAGRTPMVVAAGGSHGLALCADGALVSWGYNYDGQLGRGNTTSSNVPVAVDQTGVLAGKRLMALAAGSSHNLALCADGTLAAWGSNSNGQLGTGGSAYSKVPTVVVTAGVLAGKTVVAMAVGGYHSLALCADGTVAAWGYNNYGQLGTGSTANATVPVLIDQTGILAGKSVVAIAAGAYHSLALCADGTLAAWGYNSVGQLGRGNTINSSLPAAVTLTGVLAGKTVATIAAGSSHNLVRCSDGTLVAWGANGYGQLGNRSTTNSSVPVAVDLTGELAGRTVVAGWTNYDHNLALCGDGTLAAWGLNSAGQLGNNSTTNSTMPVVVAASALGAGERIAAATGGGEFSLALVAMPPPPVATTLAAQNVTDTTARLNGSANAMGTSATVTFEYGLTTAYGSTLSATPATVTGAAATAATATASGLLPGTIYHFRCVAQGAGGTTTGADMTFTTTATATLSNLTLSGGTLFPAFTSSTSSTSNYLATVPAATASLTVTPVASLPDATVKVNGRLVTSGTASDAINLQPGDNSIAITVTAADGINARTYTVKVARLAETVTFDSATTVPMSFSDLAATGPLPAPVLTYAPTVGTALRVVSNTGPNPIRGTFDNLLQGQLVSLIHDGITYGFAVNYFGGTGNDLVLQWANTGLVGWGSNAYSQLGNNSTIDSRVATPMEINGVLAGKTVLATANGVRHALALCADGTVAAWGENTLGQLGTGAFTASKVPVWVNLNGVLTGKKVVAIAASGSHSLALCADGTLAEWGLHFIGTQNDYSNLPALVDQTGVLAGKTVTAIGAGDGHSLALCADGTLVTWGSNANGRLGNNSNANSAVPVLVSRAGVLAGKTVTGIAAGAWHSLALCSDGTVATWGYNIYGQLGNNSTTDSNVPVAVNQTGIVAGKTIIAVAGGGYHSLALCSDGTLAAWGYNFSGQLGNNSTTNSSVPVGVFQNGVFLGRTIVEISGGGYHSLARCSDGIVAAWGNNNYGQLGNNSTTNSSVPSGVPMNALPSGSRVVAAAAGSQFCLAVAAISPPPVVTTLAATDVRDTSAILNGTVNANSLERAVTIEYGLTTAYGTTTTATPGAVTDTTATPVSASIGGLLTGTTYYFRVIASTGSASTKGADMTFTTGVATALTHLSLDHGTLYPAFAGSREDYLVTVPFATAAISMTPVAADVTSTVTINGAAALSGAAAGPFSLAVGENVFAIRVVAAGGGQTKTYHVNVTRLPGTFAFNAATNEPLSVSEFRATGDLPALVLNGVPGPGNRWTLVRNTGMNPIQGTFANLAQGQVVYVSYAGIEYPFVANYFGGTGNDLVLQWANTRLLAWGGGSPYYGQLGAGGTTSSSVPIPVDATGALAGKTVLTAAAGANHNLALCADGTLVAWGYNNYGQLGNGDQTTSNVPVSVNQTGVLADRLIIAIAVGGYHSLALCADGTLAAWGSNDSGQLCDGTTTNSITPKLVNQTGVLAGKTVIAIAAGGSFSLVLCADGTLASWGNTGYGSSSVPMLVNRTGVLAGKTVIAIAAGYAHSLALSSDGSVFAWGDNSHGQLGNYSSIGSSVPVRVDQAGVLASRTVTSIAAGYGHSLALCADGTLAAWGYDNYGQLGDNGTLDSYLPVRVDQTGILAGQTVTAIAAGSNHNLVVCANGPPAAWGANSYGQLGNFSTTNSGVPVTVVAGTRFMTVWGGASHSLALAAAAMPNATALPATAITTTTATLNGTVNAGDNAVTVSFEYGPTTAYGTTIAAVVAGGSETGVSAALSGLRSGGTYHYRVVAACSGVFARSADMTFTTTSNDATLAALGLSAGTLAPVFDPNLTTYQITVSSATSAVTVTPVTAHPGAAVRVNGVPVASGAASSPIVLPTGNTTLTVGVTAEDGVTTKTYTITVTRLLPELADPDHDGIPNLLEYAFGLDPAANSAGQLPQPVIVGDLLVIRFTQPAAVSGVIYGAQWSGTLQSGSWVELPDTGTGAEHVFSIPRNAAPNVFLRLKASRP